MIVVCSAPIYVTHYSMDVPKKSVGQPAKVFKACMKALAQGVGRPYLGLELSLICGFFFLIINKFNLANLKKKIEL